MKLTKYLGQNLLPNQSPPLRQHFRVSMGAGGNAFACGEIKGRRKQSEHRAIGRNDVKEKSHSFFLLRALFWRRIAEEEKKKRKIA